MTLGQDDGLRVKRPSGISPASIVREGKDRPELFFLRSQVPPAEGIGAPVRLERLSWGCDQIGWLPNPPCHQGVCASTLMGRHKTATRRYRVAPGAAANGYVCSMHHYAPGGHAGRLASREATTASRSLREATTASRSLPGAWPSLPGASREARSSLPGSRRLREADFSASRLANLGGRVGGFGPGAGAAWRIQVPRIVSTPLLCVSIIVCI